MKVQKWGNSLAVRIPQRTARQHGVVNGTIVEMIDTPDGILLRPKRQKPTLEDLLAQTKGKTPHQEIGFGQPEGRELI
nr:AbrB/MazE/SpoVT family DNA-binding domain-containing protein [Evansella caseinilytica]